MSSRRLHLLFHIFPIAAFPVGFLYSVNLDQALWSETWLPAGIAVLAAVLLFLPARLLFRDGGKAAALVSVFFILFYLLGLGSGLIRRREWAWAGYLLIPIALALLVAAIISLFRSRPGAPVANRVLSVFAVVLWLPVLFRLGSYYFTSPPPPDAEDRAIPSAVIPPPIPAEEMPDIFYIVLDGYGRHDVLRDFFLFDNRPFLESLARRGFYLAGESAANYPHTQQSLASALNMTYLDDLADRVGRESGDRGPLLDMIRRSRTVRLLREMGYEVAAFSSGYSGTEMPSADVYLQPPGGLTEFQQNLLNFTPLPALLKRWTGISPHDLHRRRVLYAFEKLPALAGCGAPVFVFAHVVTPHPPFVFGAEGEAVEIREQFTFADGDHYMRWYQSTPAEYRRRYNDQLTYINRLLKWAIDGILESSGGEAVIILQSDHGPGSMFSYDSLERTNLRERFGILNAYYFPGGYEGIGLYPSISPVNSFRVVFNRFFGRGYDLLPDRSYFVTITRPYLFTPVEVPEVSHSFR